MDYKAKLLAMLGLPAEATDEQISAACAGKKTEMENACSEKDALKNRAEAAEAQVQAFKRKELEAQVDADLTEFADRIANRDEVKAQLLANREGTRKILTALKPMPAPAAPAKESDKPLLNRKDAQQPDLAAAQKADADRRALRNRAIAEYRAEHPGCTHAQAAAAVIEEKPELFKSEETKE